MDVFLPIVCTVLQSGKAIFNKYIKHVGPKHFEYNFTAML